MPKLIRFVVFLLLNSTIALAPAWALLPDSTKASGGTTDTTFHPNYKPSLDVHRRIGDITIDGDLSDAGWQNAARVDEFSCALPIPYACPRVKTEAFVTYDTDYFYLAMIAHDPHPEEIRSTMIGRDNMFDDDFMGIILDTYGDATKAFEIYVNPRGCQGDLFWTATNEDATYDLIFDGEAKITSEGWQFEMRIPFRSLRFPDKPVQNFHASFWRNYPRESDFKFSWSAINFFEPCAFCQLGALTGIENIRPAGSLELLPAVVGSQSAGINGNPNGNAVLKNNPIHIEPSVGLRYAVGPATSLEATIKPDFSQVESDAAQVSVNTTFALFYPEHRPFFQDGSDLFNTYLSAVYTRSINSPLAAAKIIHRDATTNFAFLSGYDEHSPVIIPLEEKSVILPDAGTSYSNILRATRSFGDDSYLGVLGTDRRYEHRGSNSVLGIDGRTRIYENIALYGQALFSNTNEPNDRLLASLLDSSSATETFHDGSHTIEYDDERYWGYSSIIAIERYTPGLDVHFEFSQTSPEFRAGNGFVFTNNFRQASNFTGYKFPLANPPHWLDWLVEVDGSLTSLYNWNFDGERKLVVVKPELDISLVGETDIHLFYRPSIEEYHNVTFRDLHFWDFRWSTKFDRSISFSGDVSVGREIARTVDTPAAGSGIDLNLAFKLRVLEGLLIEPTYLFSQLKRDEGGFFYSGSIYRSRFTYQFNRGLDARVIVQYDGFQRMLEIDPLVTLKLNPFTAFYAGSTHNFASDPDSKIIRPSARQFFLKIQYLIET